MKKETQKQIFTLFVLFMFLGSGLAFALMYAFPTEQKQTTYIFDRPLTDEEEAVYLQSNVVVMQFFFSPTCPHCQAMEPVVEQLAEEFSGYLIVERINVQQYRQIAESNNIQGVPTFILKGSSIDKVVGEVPKENLKSSVCNLYTEPIEFC